MHAQMSAGIRGLELVSRAIGIILGDYVERDIVPDWPEGWGPDMEPFYCGLDKSTMELTPQDLQNIEGWYERTMGWQPPRVRFLARHEPVTLKSWLKGVVRQSPLIRPLLGCSPARTAEALERLARTAPALSAESRRHEGVRTRKCAECPARANGPATQATSSEVRSRSGLSVPGAGWASAAQT